MRSWKTILVTALAAAMWLAAMPANASSYSTDNSDLWGNDSESGWGIQFVQRAENLFATLYIYNNSGAPVWYVAVLQPSTGTTWMV